MNVGFVAKMKRTFGTGHSDGFHGLPQFSQENVGMVPRYRPLPLPTPSLPFYNNYSSCNLI